MKTALSRASLIALLIGSISAAPGPQPAAPAGPVRALGHAVADDRGPFNALGATLFWAAWGYKYDRARLERNLETLREAGFDYVRVLGSVGGPTWEDRTVDPRWDDYDAVVTGLTDLVHEHGMRVQWTVFGGAPFTPSGAAREALIDRMATLMKGREHKVFAIEVANEARTNGFRGPAGLAELRRLGERLDARTPILVALSAPSAADACDTYAGARVDAATLHYPRAFGAEGPLRPLRQPWSYPSAYEKQCPGELPQLVFNNEPIGPQSSVNQDADPGRIAAAFALTFVANHAAYVLHTGPGIRGGGKADRALGRQANFDELRHFQNIALALQAARSYLPAGLANWTRQAKSSGVYLTTSKEGFVAVAPAAAEAVTFRAPLTASIHVRQTMTGRVLKSLDVRAGDVVTLPLSTPDPIIFIGAAKQR